MYFATYHEDQGPDIPLDREILGHQDTAKPMDGQALVIYSSTNIDKSMSIVDFHSAESWSIPTALYLASLKIISVASKSTMVIM